MFLGTATANANAATYTSSVAFGPKSQTVEEYVREYYAEDPVLISIARCESKFRQYDENGQVLRGVEVPDDIGLMQINEHFHGETAKGLGFDIRTIDGNLAYAKYLYEKQGTAPWTASKACWGAKKAQPLASK